MRAYRARAVHGAVLVRTTIDQKSRAKVGDIAARNAALERIRNELDQALSADPLGVTRLHVYLTIERPRKGDTDP